MANNMQDVITYCMLYKITVLHETPANARTAAKILLN